LVDNWSFLYSLWSVTEWSYHRNFEGVPPYPDFSRFGKSSHKVTQFYTTAIRALAKESLDCQKIPVDTLKVIGSVGEPMKKLGTGIMTMWAASIVLSLIPGGKQKQEAS
jgi:acyl-coenzyme A synthetase/AMP-(fatty) acid ligase